MKALLNLFCTLLAAQAMGQIITPGNIIWSEDFNSVRWSSYVSAFNWNTFTGNLLIDPDSLPYGWTVYDGTGNNFYWHWSQLGPRGKYTGGYWDPIDPWFDENYCYYPSNDPDVLLNSKTSSNGVMMLEADYFNTAQTGCLMVDPPVNMDSYIMTPIINIAGAQNLILRFSQRFRYCCDTNLSKLSVFVSPDYNPQNPNSAHWYEYPMTEFIRPNQYPEQNPLITELNISEVASGFNQVSVKWYMTGASHYVWMIDDVELVEPFSNYLEIVDSWITIGNSSQNENPLGGYVQIPMGLAGCYNYFNATVLNNGVFPQTGIRLQANIYKDNEVIYQTHSSEEITVQTHTYDTINAQGIFTPYQLGKYDLRLSITGDSMNSWPQNNQIDYKFFLTDSIYSRVSPFDSNYSAQESSPMDYGITVKQWAVLFQIPSIGGMNYSTCGISVFIYPDGNDVTANEIKLKSILCRQGTDGNPIDTIAISAIYQLKISDLGTWVYLPFKLNNTLVLQEGSYFAILDFNFQTDYITLFIAADNQNIPPLGVVKLLPVNPDHDFFYPWINYHENPAIRLHVKSLPNEITEPKEAESFQIWPNPASGKINISAPFPVSDVKIYSVSGQKVRELKGINIREMSLSGLTKGLYFVKVSDNLGNQLQSKVVIK